MRCLAPAGGFPNPLAALKASAASDISASLVKAISALYDRQQVSLTSSGKKGIEIVSTNLRNRGLKNLVTGGYGCPDIVAAASRAGLRVRLVDVNSETLEPDFSNTDPSTDILLFSNLYGLVDSVEKYREFKIIDDACQAAFSFDNGKRVGGRGLGVLSFGRGKAICGVGGGAIVGLTETSLISDQKNESLVKLFLYANLENPYLYGIPASLPFLKLGETKFEPDYKDKPLDIGMVATANEAVKEFSKESEIRKVSQERWTTVLSGNSNCRVIKRDTGSPVLTRLPILVPGNRDRVYSELKSAGLGASVSYPDTLSTLCKGYVESGNLLGAASVASQIITLPTHRFVTDRDIARAADIIRRN